MRLYTALEWQRMGWHARDRARVARVVLVEQLRAEHRDRYPVAHKAFCEVAGCSRRSRALGMCDTHYRRWRRSAAERRVPTGVIPALAQPKVRNHA